jgi:hypothetical protein
VSSGRCWSIILSAQRKKVEYREGRRIYGRGNSEGAGERGKEEGRRKKELKKTEKNTIEIEL